MLEGLRNLALSLCGTLIVTGILMMLLPLLYIVFIWVGYELGRRRISIGNRLVYENKNAKKGAKK